MWRHVKPAANAAVYLIVAIILVGVVGTLVLKQPFLLAPIRSNSMYPLMQRGDLVVIWPVTDRSRVDGQVVVFRQSKGNLASKGWVIHRVVAGNEDGFTTKGDANEHTDQFDGAMSVKATEIAARAIELSGHPIRLKWLGYPALWLEQNRQSPILLLGVLGSAFVLLLWSEISTSRRHKVRFSRVPTYILYPMIGLTVSVSLAALQLGSASFLKITYEVTAVNRGTLQGSPIGILALGDTKDVTVAEVSRKSAFPMIVTAVSEDRQITFNSDVIVASHGQMYGMRATILAEKIGLYKSSVTIGAFLPLLPPRLIRVFAGVSYWLALVAISIIPSLPLILWPLLEPSSRRTMTKDLRKYWARLRTVF